MTINPLKPFMMRNTPEIKKPVFILSSPRSGSTHLYEILRRCKSVISLNQENDTFWWSSFPYSRLDRPSDLICGDEIHEDNLRHVRDSFSLYIYRKLYKQNLPAFLKFRFFDRNAAYIEKTVANCFHLEALLKLFPDAKYIHLIRDGRATVSSMIEGWKSNRFMHRTLPFPENSSIDYWTFPIPPGWERIIHANLNEICAWSWIQHNAHVLDFFNNNISLRESYIKVAYEDLIDDPYTIIDSLVDFCGFIKSESVVDYLQSNLASRTTITAPDPMKWKNNFPKEIDEIEDYIKPMMSKLGYPESSLKQSANSSE